MYKYEELRPFIFTEYGQAMFMNIYKTARDLLQKAGAFKMDHVMRGMSGDCWTMIACVDRLVELGEIYEVTQAGVYGQDRVFVAGKIS